MNIATRFIVTMFTFNIDDKASQFVTHKFRFFGVNIRNLQQIVSAHKKTKPECLISQEHPGLSISYSISARYFSTFSLSYIRILSLFAVRSAKDNNVPSVIKSTSKPRSSLNSNEILACLIRLTFASLSKTTKISISLPL